MPNAIYPKAKEQFLQAGINLISANVRVALIDLGVYTYSATHEFLSQVTGVVATSPLVSAKSATDGNFASLNTVTFSLVSGTTAEALILYVDTGTASTSRLVAFFDTGVTGLPITPNGGDISLAFGAGTGVIFTL